MRADDFKVTMTMNLKDDEHLVSLSVKLSAEPLLQLRARVEVAETFVTFHQFSICDADDQPVNVGVAVLRELVRTGMRYFGVETIHVAETSRTMASGRRPRPLTFGRRCS